MSRQQNEYLIPTKTQYSEIEPAFMSCSVGGEYISIVANGPISKVIGNCMQRRQGTGQCVGTFHSKDVDASDTPWSCINQEYKSSNVCSLATGVDLPLRSKKYDPQPQPQGSASAVSVTHPQPQPPSHDLTKNSRNNNNVVVARSLSELQKYDQQQQQGQQGQGQLEDPNLSVNNAYTNPFQNGFNPYTMSFSVFSKPYLARGKQESSDPAGYMQGVSTYASLMKNAEQSTILPNEPWGTCSSYGNYSSAPNASLSAGSMIGGSCVSGSCLEGDYTMSYQQAQKMLKQKS